MQPVFVHERILVDADQHERTERVVECPEKGVVPRSTCESCPSFFEERFDNRRGCAVVDCASMPLPSARKRSLSLELVTTVGDIMTHDYVALAPDVLAEVARRRLVDNQIGCLLLLDDRRFPIGIVTLRDFVERLAQPSQLVREIATRSVMKVPAALPVARASAIMAFEGVHHLVVVDATGVAIGVLSSLDVLRWLGQRDGMLIPRTTARQRASDFASGPRRKS